MNIKLLREIIVRYVALDPNDAFGTEKCWNEITDILSEDISATINFFESDCTDEEFYWIGSVFEDIIDKTQSKDLIQVWRSRLASVNPESYNQQNFKSEHMRKYIDYEEYVKSINMEIEYAEAMLED